MGCLMVFYVGEKIFSKATEYRELLGKFDDYFTFEYERRRIFSAGIVRSKNDEALLKFYIAFKPENLFEIEDLVDEVKHFIGEKSLALIARKSKGIGYSVLSEECLNITLWRIDSPSVDTAIYSIEPAINLKNSKDPFEILANRQDVRRASPLRIWEARIAGHEAEVWEEYIKSGGGVNNLSNYLRDFYRGE
jgi:hypothetical protein